MTGTGTAQVEAVQAGYRTDQADVEKRQLLSVCP